MSKHIDNYLPLFTTKKQIHKNIETYKKLGNLNICMSEVCVLDGETTMNETNEVTT